MAALPVLLVDREEERDKVLHSLKKNVCTQPDKPELEFEPGLE